ncbi:MAG: hypothetical protein KME64_06590 [Scytonematopsis contorta HA4267-MV1]|nr:hypothetical protein [Scytonematopsis contorta HA4267-MV1]
MLDLSGNEIVELSEALLSFSKEQDLIDWLQKNS